MQKWSKQLKHFARKLPQAEGHKKPHSLHQHYQDVILLQPCCFLKAPWFKAMSICGARISRLFAPKMRLLNLELIVLIVMVLVTQMEAKKM